MAGGTKTSAEKQAAIEAACQLMDLAAPTSVVVAAMQRHHGYSRAQAYRLAREAGEIRGQQGISGRPSGSDLAAMAQIITAQALASAHLDGDWKAVARLGRELRETLKSTGSITSVPPPDPDQLAEQVQAVRLANQKDSSAKR